MTGSSTLSAEDISSDDISSPDSNPNTSTPKSSQIVKKFPRELRLAEATLIVYQPQLEAWTNYNKLMGWAAVLIKSDKTDNIVTGAIKFSASTDVENETRTVVAYNRQILAMNFPTLTATQVTKLKSSIHKVLSKVPEIIPLDMLLAAMVDKKNIYRTVAVSVKPPTIYYSKKPAILVLFDGKAVFTDIKETSLMYAINTNWDIFKDSKTQRYYLRHDKQWLVASDVKGPWKASTKLAKDLAKLPRDKNWQNVLHSIPPEPAAKGTSTKVYVSNGPAELIVTKGIPEKISIAGTALSYIKNTQSDLFFHNTHKRYYYLVSGRWFKAKSLNGVWSHEKKLPDAFTKIPADHIKANVRSSVAGTVEAELAVLQAHVPHKATVARTVKSVNVIYAGEPKFEPIRGTTLSYAINTAFDVIQAGDRYYLCYQGVWFTASTAKGVWHVASSIPKEIYKIPPDSPIYNVTYVKIYDSTTTTVTVGYTSGYHNMYISYGVVYYGTGYYYPPYYWYGHGYPIYYPHYPSYGVAAYYNPYTGTYGRGAYVYGPYGGYGRGASYNPETGRYSRGVAAWGATDGVYARQAYNPNTGIHTQTIQSTNSYAQWGNSVVRHGDDWIKTSHYTDEKGARRQIETSSGAKGAQFKGQDHSVGVLKNKDGELFVGKDQNVYKQTDDGWLKREGDEWVPIDRSFDPADAKNKLIDKGVNQESAAAARDKINQQGFDRSNIEKLNRDSSSRNYGNQRYNEYQSQRQSGQTYQRGSSSRGRNNNRPSRSSFPRGGGRFGR